MELLTAAGNGNLERVRTLLDRGADLNYQEKEFGWTPLISASYQGRLPVVKELLRRGATVDLIDTAGDTALMTASTVDHLDIVKELLSHGADVNKQSNTENTALIYATKFGYLNMIRELLNYGADPYLRDAKGKSSLDHMRENMIFTPDFRAVLTLLENYGEEDPNAIDEEGINNVMIAAANGANNRLNAYFKKDVDPNAQDIYGNTALHYAVANRKGDTIDLLIANGADSMIPNKAGVIPNDEINKLIDERKDEYD